MSQTVKTSKSKIEQGSYGVGVGTQVPVVATVTSKSGQTSNPGFVP
jgi:hypothetical protein